MIVLLDQYTANGTSASILTLMSRPCGMTQKWWCGAGRTGRPSVTAGCGDVLPDIYIENRMYRTPRNLKKLNVMMKAGVCWTSKITRSVNLLRRLPYGPPSYRCLYHHHTEHRDFDSDKASSAARAAWGNSSSKLSSNRVRRSSRNTTNCIRPVPATAARHDW